MEALVQLEIAAERLDRRAPDVERRVERGHDLRQRRGPAIVHRSRGCEPARHTFERAPQLDGLLDVLQTECPYGEPARGATREQALVLERLHRQPQRRARHADAIDGLELGDTVTGGQRAGQDHLAEPQHGPQHLRGAAFTSLTSGSRHRRANRRVRSLPQTRARTRRADRGVWKNCMQCVIVRPP
jgi:hypothetical protein